MSLSWLGSRSHPKVHEKCLHEFETWTCRMSSALSVPRAPSHGISLTGVYVPAGLFCFFFIYDLARTLCAAVARLGSSAGPRTWRVQGHGAECTLMPAALACCHGASMRNAPQDEPQDRGGERSARSPRANGCIQECRMKGGVCVFPSLAQTTEASSSLYLSAQVTFCTHSLRFSNKVFIPKYLWSKAIKTKTTHRHFVQLSDYI